MAIVVPYQPGQIKDEPISRPQMSGADPVAAATAKVGEAISGVGAKMMDQVRIEREKQDLVEKTNASTAATKAALEISKKMSKLKGETALPSVAFPQATQPEASMDPQGATFSLPQPEMSAAPVQQTAGAVAGGLSEFDALRDSYLGKTPKHLHDTVKALFAEKRNSLERDLLLHEQQQSDFIASESMKSGVASQLEEAVRAAVSPADAASYIERAVQTQSDFLRLHKGLPQDVIDRDAAELRSKGQVEVIKSIQAVSPIQALERFKLVKDQILPSDSAQLEQQLKLQSDSFTALEISDRVTVKLKADPQGKWDPEAAQELIRKETSDPNLIKMSRELVQQAIQDHSYSVAIAVENNRGTILQAGHDKYWGQNKQMPMAVVKAMPEYALLDDKGKAELLGHVETENYRIESRDYTRQMRELREENRAQAKALKARGQDWTGNANYFRLNPEEMAQMSELEWKKKQRGMSARDWVALDKQRTKLIKEPQFFTQQSIDMSAVRQVLGDAEFNDPGKQQEAIETAVKYLKASRKSADHVFSPQEARELTIAALQPVAINTTRKSFLGIEYGSRGEVKRLGNVEKETSIVVPQEFRDRFPNLRYDRQIKLYKEFLKTGSH